MTAKYTNGKSKLKFCQEEGMLQTSGGNGLVKVQKSLNIVNGSTNTKPESRSEISGAHGSECEDRSLPGYSTV
jgi:hypothetical protein